jgi:CheY-like chemotaxis protein
MSTDVQDTTDQLSAATDRHPPVILVVDDIAVERRFAGGLAERHAGLHAIYAANGSEAMEMIARESPVLVLTDLQMPGMNGLQLVEAVRAQHPHLPVVLMTAHGSEDLAFQALKAGAASYVPKRDLAHQLGPTLVQILVASAAGKRRRRLLGFLEARTSVYCLENDPAMGAEIMGLLSEELASVGFGDENTRMRLTIALQEAFSNALYHGNLEVSSDLRQDDERRFYELAEARRTMASYRDRRIRVRARIERQEVQIAVSDEGPGFDTSRLERPFDPEDLMRIGGRGLSLIRTLMDEVTFNETGNQINMVKR